MGHVRVYALSDAVARFHRLCGRSVLHPIGWDSFGLPAENAARDRGVSPRDWTRDNIAQMRTQLTQLGFAFDWDREVSTCEPEYFCGTQRLFGELFKRGLIYQADAAVNWDPVDCTVLANEQVDAQGRSWRSGAVVEKRDLRQWFARITEYSDRLLEGIERDLGAWPEQVKKQQVQWIGKPMHDWLISRQRPWGTPIPIVHCDAGCGAVLETQLPVTESGVQCACPSCGSPTARRESDTMDTFVDSSWYYLKYAEEAEDEWMPVDVYVGGIEHAVLHLLYARFVGLVLKGKEPFSRLLAQGMVQNRTWRTVGAGVPVKGDEVDGDAMVLKKDGTTKVEATWEKMSKSKFNGIDPAGLVERYGADATRLFVLFRAPPTMALEWDDAGVLGMARWLQRVWQLCHVSDECGVDAGKNSDAGWQKKESLLKQKLDATVAKVTRATGERFLFNTAIAALMELSNTLKKTSPRTPGWRFARKQLLVMMMPYAPHFAHHAWPIVNDAADEVPKWPTTVSHNQ